MTEKAIKYRITIPIDYCFQCTVRIVMSDISKRIRDLRSAAGLSQDELSALSDIPQKTISNYESGKTELSALNAIKLAYVFQVTIDYLLTGDGQSNGLKLTPKELLSLNKWRSGDRLGAIRVIAGDE